LLGCVLREFKKSARFGLRPKLRGARRVHMLGEEYSFDYLVDQDLRSLAGCVGCGSRPGWEGMDAGSERPTG
jgi:hypothetical protein